MNERRDSLRYPCDKPVNVSGVGEETYFSEACDISEQGLCLFVPRPAVAELSVSGLNFDIGQKIKVSFLDDADGIQRKIVCSVAHSSRLSDEQYLVGLHFEDLREETQNFINGLIRLK